jgi:hypothetical protein
VVGHRRHDHLCWACHSSDRVFGTLANATTVVIFHGTTQHSAPGNAPRRAAIRTSAMNASTQRRASHAVWLMLAISGCWLMYLFVSHYGSCRTDGTGKLGCFFLAVFGSLFEAVAFVVGTIAKLLTAVLP